MPIPRQNGEKMYCVKCGVELADGTKRCPLCQTPVYYPDAKDAPPTYPAFVPDREIINPRGIYFILSFVFTIGAIISLICDINVTGGISWSVLVVGGLILTYVIAVLPGWFSRPSPAIFAPVDFLAAAIYLFVIEFYTKGDWYFTFALPTVAMSALIVLSVIILSYYIKRGYLYIFGGASIALGIFSIIVELLVNVNFGLQNRLVWSLYPCIAFSLIGIMLIIVAIVKPFRESLRKIFAL